jgi:hypothetical protein
MKSKGFLETPQDIMEKYNGCSVPQYTAYRSVRCRGCLKSAWGNLSQEYAYNSESMLSFISLI